MSLQATVETLDGVPEEFHGLYEQKGERYRLMVEGVEFPEEVDGLKSALEKERKARKEAEKARGALPEGFDPEEYTRLREEAAKREEDKAKQEGRWEELRTKLKGEHDARQKALADELAAKDGVIAELVVHTELRTALEKIGVADDYRDAVEALMEKRGPKVENIDGKPVGVFPDELHGSKPIREYLEAWAKTDEAAKYMPPSGAAGGGATGRGTGAGGATEKPLSEMSEPEKVAYVRTHGSAKMREKIAAELG